MSSFTPATVTVCGVAQFDGVKVSAAPAATAPGSELTGATVTMPVGSVSRTTV